MLLHLRLKCTHCELFPKQYPLFCAKLLTSCNGHPSHFAIPRTSSTASKMRLTILSQFHQMESPRKRDDIREEGRLSPGI